MPGSTTFFSATESEEVASKPQQNMIGTRQPPPVAPRTTSITLQSWQQAHPSGDTSYGDERYARSASTDSLESSSSSSSGGCSSSNRITDGAGEYIPTRTVGKTPKLPSHNPLQFVKVQSPLYKKAEQQIKLTKEVKITREALKEGEEEWQSNLDNWKSRRRKVSEKVIQRAEEMRQIEAEEQLRQEQSLQQQKKIKKFSEIVEKKSTRSYNLELYIGQGDDSGLGGTPEPDDTLDCHSSHLRSDTSEGMTSEAESVDSDIHKSDKISEKEPPKVPQKPTSRFKKSASVSYDCSETTSSELFQQCISRKDLSISDNNSSAEPSDIEGHAGDTEATSSEEDATFSGQIGNIDSGLDSLGDNQRGDLVDSASDLSQDSCSGLEKSHEKLQLDLTSEETEEEKSKSEKDIETSGECNLAFKLFVKHGDNRGFGFTLKGGKDQGCPAYIENVTKGGPADEVGLKDGDKIVSLNGELAADYSYASLVFSVKQAVYTGMLDVVINRSENNDNTNSEMKPKEAKKGKSFAEKLAIFTSGVSSSTSNNEEPKTSTKTLETKRESLVLRRRSAFENGNTETVNVVNRRSSCFSHASNPASEKPIDKRRSVDLTLSQDAVHEENLVKKGPPPPVPVKPKIKSKPIFSEVNKPPLSKLGDTNDVLLPSDTVVNGTDNIVSKSLNSYENPPILSNELENGKCEYSCHKLKSDSHNDSIESKRKMFSNNAESRLALSPEPEVNYEDNDAIIHCHNLPHESDGAQVIDNKSELNTSEETVKIETANFVPNDSASHNEIILEAVNKACDAFGIENENFETCQLEEQMNSSYELDADVEKLAETYEDITITSNVETSLPHDVQISTECAINMHNDVTASDGLEEDVENKKGINSSVSTSACYSSCNYVEDNVDINSHSKEFIDDLLGESEATENKNSSQTNTSPLCLSLEKIDEDDVISASTTTSSDTPDTETVIETLPSNISPLPNDESNGEDASKIINYQDREAEQLLEVSETTEKSSNETYSENEFTETYLERENPDINDIPETSDDVFVHSYNYDMEEAKDDVFEKSYHEQDDDYARELDESLDQITSLDIIDRIERSLMDQLQKEDAYEDITENLNSQLEGDINNPWLYFSEESELLEDLTPRNLEPPRDPPPPPPPPEPENVENKVMTIGRTNSTKRIKKELWRRRSDFLGLDSPEAIDIDKIPPPPPGLEELLKQEREQTQWLEKRLSLVEPEMEISPYQAESVCLDSGAYSNNDYSEYFDDDTDDLAKDTADTEQDKWSENIDDETLFETSYGLQYDQVPGQLSTGIEKNDSKSSESPQHKAKQNIQSLGAAPKAKIMDSTKWITEKVVAVNKKTIEPVFRQMSYNQNYWLTQDGEKRRNMQYSDAHPDRRYSMPPVYSNSHPDVTVRTWGDREYEYQQHRPRSAIYDRLGNEGNMYDQYMNMEKKDLQRTQSLDSHRDRNFDTDTLESEVHKCSCCGKGLCEGSAMGIEALRLYFHIECFRCCVCQIPLGNGSCGTDVQVKNNQLYCPACFTVD